MYQRFDTNGYNIVLFEQQMLPSISRTPSKEFRLSRKEMAMRDGGPFASWERQSKCWILGKIKHCSDQDDRVWF